MAQVVTASTTPPPEDALTAGTLLAARAAARGDRDTQPAGRGDVLARETARRTVRAALDRPAPANGK